MKSYWLLPYSINEPQHHCPVSKDAQRNKWAFWNAPLSILIPKEKRWKSYRLHKQELRAFIKQTNLLNCQGGSQLRGQAHFFWLIYSLIYFIPPFSLPSPFHPLFSCFPSEKGRPPKRYQPKHGISICSKTRHLHSYCLTKAMQWEHGVLRAAKESETVSTPSVRSPTKAPHGTTITHSSARQILIRLLSYSPEWETAGFLKCLPVRNKSF